MAYRHQHLKDKGDKKMANIKSIESLRKAAETITEAEVLNIINNENVTEVSNREVLAVLIYQELKKALDTKETTLLLDCNYAESKFHNRTDKEKANGIEDTYLVDYFRLISNDSGKSLIQFYCQPDTGRDSCTFRMATSCAKLVREQFIALEEDLKFTIKRRPNGNPRWSERKAVSYVEVVDVTKAVVSILTSVEMQKLAEKAAKEEAKKKAKEEAKAKEKKTTKKTKKEDK